MRPLIYTNLIAMLILNGSFIIWFTTEMIHTFAHRVGANTVSNDHHSGLVICISLGAAVLLAYRLAGAETFATILWHPIWVFGFGIALMLIGMAFRWYAIDVLGKYFSVRLAIQPNQTVTREGPYRWIRHPSYTGSLITMLGLGLTFTNWLCLFSTPLIALAGYIYRAKVEEQMLLGSLGEQYREYMKTTKRFIPFIY